MNVVMRLKRYTDTINSVTIAINAMYEFLKNRIAHHVVKAQDCTKLINWLFAKNVKLIVPVFDVNVLITL